MHPEQLCSLSLTEVQELPPGKSHWCNLCCSMANRPQLDPKRKQTASEQVVVRLLPHQAEKLRRAAAKRGTSVSELVREAVEQVSA